jgi:hypothetical protein
MRREGHRGYRFARFYLVTSRSGALDPRAQVLGILRCSPPAQAAARLAVFDFIEGWYNPRRRHSALDYLSPLMYERTAGIGDRPVPSGATIDQGGAISLSPSGAVQ